LFQGYLNNIESTRNAITPDLWYKTGDVATRDADGFYYIVDRKKELIKYKVLFFFFSLKRLVLNVNCRASKVRAEP
jgi:acyl-CoA synthetase (AMP-forming)/AMP-acid ligase II